MAKSTVERIESAKSAISSSKEEGGLPYRKARKALKRAQRRHKVESTVTSKQEGMDKARQENESKRADKASKRQAAEEAALKAAAEKQAEEVAKATAKAKAEDDAKAAEKAKAETAKEGENKAEGAKAE